MDKKIIVVETGSVADETLSAMREQGFFVIEATDVSKVRVINAEELPLDSNDVVMSALGVLQGLSNSNPSQDFLQRLFKRMLAKEKKNDI